MTSKKPISLSVSNFFRVVDVFRVWDRIIERSSLFDYGHFAALNWTSGSQVVAVSINPLLNFCPHVGQVLVSIIMRLSYLLSEHDVRCRF